MPFHKAETVTVARILLGKLNPLSIPSLISKSVDADNIRTSVDIPYVFRIEIPKLLIYNRNYLVKSI